MLDRLGQPLPPATDEARESLVDTLWTEDMDADDMLTQAAEDDLMAALGRHAEQYADHYLAQPD